MPMAGRTRARTGWVTLTVWVAVGWLGISAQAKEENDGGGKPDETTGAPAAPLVNPTANPVRPSVSEQIEKGELLGHIQYLASPELRGREAGSPEQLTVARYVADEFNRYGLEPYGEPKDGQPSYFQEFPLPVSKGFSEASALKFTVDGREKAFAAGKDFAPLPAGEKKSHAEGGVAFAGYGISAPEYQYDDFAGLELAGKWALILRYEPQEEDPQSKFDGKRITRYAALTSKVGACLLRKALGVLIVTGPGSKGGKADALTDGVGSFFGDFEAPVMQIMPETANALLAPLGATLGDLQGGIDKDLSNHSKVIPGVTLAGVSEFKVDPHLTANVLARLPGRDEKLRDEVVIVGAHCDHVGLGYFGSRSGKAGAGKIHPGADDNASGTAGLLEIAQHFGALKPEARPRRSILFMAFSGEEKGLLGSEYYIKHPRIPLKDSVTMLNLDMIGRSVGGAVQVAGIGTGKGFKDLVQKHLEDPLLKIHLGSGGEAPSDHTNFYRQKIPVLFFFTGTHDDYHGPTDTWDKINAPAAAAVAELASKLTFEVADALERPEYMKSSGRTYLGIAPDPKAMQTARGYPVAKVEAGSPADLGGLKTGDLIVGLNGSKFSNAQDLMMDLIGYAPGDPVELAVTRGDESLTLKIVLGDRSKPAAKKEENKEEKPKTPEGEAVPAPTTEAGTKEKG